MLVGHPNCNPVNSIYITMLFQAIYMITIFPAHARPDMYVDEGRTSALCLESKPPPLRPYDVSEPRKRVEKKKTTTANAAGAEYFRVKIDKSHWPVCKNPDQPALELSNDLHQDLRLINLVRRLPSPGPPPLLWSNEVD